MATLVRGGASLESSSHGVTRPEAASKLTRSVSEGDSTLDIPMPSLTLRATFRVLKPHLLCLCSRACSH